MVFAIIAALAFAVSGVVISIIALTKDEITQGLYGHVAFYLFIFSIGTIGFGSFVGIKGSIWNILIFTSLLWIIVARVLTVLRKFKLVTYLHIVGGIVTIIWIIINSILV